MVRNRMLRTATTAAMLLALVSACGEPVRGVGDDAKAAKAQAHEAVQAAEDAAKRVDELSRAQIEQAPPAGEPPPGQEGRHE